MKSIERPPKQRRLADDRIGVRCRSSDRAWTRGRMGARRGVRRGPRSECGGHGNALCHGPRRNLARSVARAARDVVILRHWAIVQRGRCHRLRLRWHADVRRRDRARVRNGAGRRERSRLALIARVVALAVATMLGGCATVPQNRRARLADPMMGLRDEPLDAASRQKLYDTREGASGGDGVTAGGGCGCQ